MVKTEKPRSSVNWTLWVGLAFVLLVILLAAVGPALAPSDPLKENFIGRTGERFIKPPFAPRQVEGFPLGSDEWGRDLLSRLLWAVRPTLTLVLVVAGLRLAIGILFGLISGWSNRLWARILDGLISFGISAPVLFVALCVIAAVGNEWGVWAFIAGLSLTGWAEAARVVREQTRSLRGQAFVEAARGMGATSEQLILSHVLPHVLPLMWIQLAFEVSGALLATASLGFPGVLHQRGVDPNRRLDRAARGRLPGAGPDARLGDHPERALGGAVRGRNGGFHRAGLQSAGRGSANTAQPGAPAPPLGFHARIGDGRGVDRG